MSNIITGEIYEKIIQEVISASQNDFEENGVQQQTLMELQQVGHVFPSTSPDFITHILAAYSPEAFHALLVRSGGWEDFQSVLAELAAACEAEARNERAAGRGA
ncbi:hypothetical protein M438DRAFT_328121 [Aureobasidium pullulans EXF-150]|uniref:Uncharacterized protein n=1 Tax=Aureobasidium pullulans EXF-150 TaxID=1043002 RepID=A0A074XXF4_AURPU|nr:uncharacterized protein M438DRAFT_328121 [Aureobasidium pullulans EXF-150]KEQ79366.1 hypothetical protein M438DRAFT_328121 [Aureobasidium pullulans EXF-150]